MTINKNGDIFSCFTPGRIYRSTNNGQSWLKLWDSTLNTIVYSMAIDTNDNIFAATSTRTPGPFGFYIGKLIYSSDNGNFWNSADSGISGATITTLAVNKSNAFFAGSYNGKIYRSIDEGITWQLVREGSIGDNIQCLAFNSKGDILAGSFSGNNGGQIYISSNNGNSWDTLTSPNRSIYSLYVDNNDTIYIGTYDAPSNDGGIFRSVDDGISWDQIGLQNMSISSILPVGKDIYASTYNNGIYRSTNGGTIWESINDGLNTSEIRVLKISPNGFLFAGTISGGVYRSYNPVAGLERIGDYPPAFFLLEQNYPNPFNPTTTILYELMKRSFVNLTVYNALGQQIAQLVNEHQEAGKKQITFNGKGLISGIYFYRIKTGNYIATKKMLLLK